MSAGPPSAAGRRPRLLVHSYSSVIGGAEQSLATLLRHLDPRFRVSVYATDREVAHFLGDQRPTERVETLPAASGGTLAASRALARAFAQAEPDVIHLNRTWIWDPPVDVLAGLLTRGAKVIAHEHSQPSPSPSLVQRTRRRWLTRRLDALVTASHNSARLSERCLGLPEGFARTIYNGVEATAAPLPARRPGDPPTIGAIGRLSPEKGYDDLPRVLEQIPGARAIVLGDGPERERLLELASSHGVAERFELAGRQADVGAWLARFDVLVVPSRVEGAPPLAALEAMMAGVPVVAADVGAVSEAVSDGETGLLVPAEDPAAMAVAVASLLGDEAMRRRLATAARQRVSAKFQSDTMAGRFADLYERIIAGRN